jgi:hypothetical protein
LVEAIAEPGHGRPWVDEHAFLSEVLQLGVVYDQMNIGCLAAFEAIARRYQIHEEMYAQEMDQRQCGEIDWAGERALFAGSSLNHYGCLVCPALKEWIATEVSKKVAILKETGSERGATVRIGSSPGGRCGGAIGCN